MRISANHVLLAFAFAGNSVLANMYSISSTVIGSDFLSAFGFEAIPDPTHGFVNYISESAAQSAGLIHSTPTNFMIKADDTTLLSPNGTGRNSFRIKSYATYTTHVAIFDIYHMPQGCGTWPAIWEVDEANYPDYGEIDIVEGVNDQSPNQSTLHTGPGCTIPASGVAQSGTTVATDCNANDNENEGCGIISPDIDSYGPSFNDAGGGWYAMERTNTSIKVWFWSRDCARVPRDVFEGCSSINTAAWGEPTAHFPNTDCDIPSSFGSLNIIINLTFCGDWAGNPSVYPASGCPSTCADYVASNPSAFSEAYFDFASLRIYE